MNKLQLFLEFHRISEDDAMKFLHSTWVKIPRTEDDLICSCGTPNKISHNGTVLQNYCGKKECNPKTGVKRPEHSKKMKELAKTNVNLMQSLIKPGELRNPTLNSPEFLSKFLGEHKTFSDYSSNVMNKSRKSRRTRILNRLSKWDSEWIELLKTVIGYSNEITGEYLDSLSEERFDIIFSRSHGIQSTINSKKIFQSRNRFFKRELMKDLKWNREKITCIQTRSTYESNYIRLFERTNTPWSYESVTLINKDKSGVYTPDFIIEKDGKTYFIEVKGDWYNQDESWYRENKISSLIEYSKEHGMIPVLTFIPNPSNFDFLEKDKLC